MIKVISVGHHPALTIIQRGGKRVVLALAIEIGTTPERLGDLDMTTPVVFGIEEIPLKAAQTLVSEHQGLVAHYDGKGLSGDQAAEVRSFVGRVVGSIATQVVA